MRIEVTTSLAVKILTYSSVIIPDTIATSLPPLYDLDEWSQCQRPGDVYCIVDAVLYATKPSQTMVLLQVSIWLLTDFNCPQLGAGLRLKYFAD